ncbi:hypothetical protein TNCV_2314361 [Trichonephila clavipes]|nr:hypothetical protein TNCV_2314361 [Trichonephila clavipes]
MQYHHLGPPSVKKFKTLILAAKVMLTIFWDANGVLYMEFRIKGLTVNSNRGTVQQYDHLSNIPAESDRKDTSFFCIMAMQDRISVHKHMTSWKKEIHSGSTTSLQPRFGTVGLHVVSKIEGDIEESMFFNGC